MNNIQYEKINETRFKKIEMSTTEREVSMDELISRSDMIDNQISQLKSQKQKIQEEIQEAKNIWIKSSEELKAERQVEEEQSATEETDNQ